MSRRFKKHHLALIILLGLLAGLYIFWYQADDNAPDFLVRPYDEAKDYSALINIMNDNLFWLSERKEFSPHRILSWRAPFDDEKRKGEAKIAVAERNDDTAGFIAYFKNSPREGFIWLIGVDKKFRGLGLGETLMRHAIQELKRQKAEYIILATRTINQPALKLYKKLGFVEQSTNERGIITLILRNP